MSRRAFSRSWAELDPDRRNAIFLIGGIAVVLVIAFALIGYGYYTNNIASKHSTVISVGSRSFDYAAVERRTKSEAIRGAIDSMQGQQAVVDVILRMEREEIIRQLAPDLGITATDEEVVTQVKSHIAVAADSSIEAYASRLKTYLIRNNLTYSDFYDLNKAEVLDHKMREKYGAEVPAEAEQVKLHLFQGDTQEAANQAKARIDGGESFTRVAVDASTHSSKDNGGQLDWTPRGTLPDELDNAAFALEPEKSSDVISYQDKFYVLLIDAKETRPVAEEAKQRVIEQEMTAVTTTKREALGSRLTLTEAQLQRLIVGIQTVTFG